MTGYGFVGEVVKWTDVVGLLSTLEMEVEGGIRETSWGWSMKVKTGCKGDGCNTGWYLQKQRSPASRIQCLMIWCVTDIIIIIEIKCSISVKCLNHPQTISLPAPDLWKDCLPWNWSLVPKRLGVTVQKDRTDGESRGRFNCSRSWH